MQELAGSDVPKLDFTVIASSRQHLPVATEPHPTHVSAVSIISVDVDGSWDTGQERQPHAGANIPEGHVIPVAGRQGVTVGMEGQRSRIPRAEARNKRSVNGPPHTDLRTFAFFRTPASHKRNIVSC